MRRRSSAKGYIASVRHPEGGTYEYVYIATERTRREAENAARESARHWGGTLVGFTPALDYGGESRSSRRLLVIAASTVAVGGATIAAAMMVGLALEGGL